MLYWSDHLFLYGSLTWGLWVLLCFLCLLPWLSGCSQVSAHQGKINRFWREWVGAPWLFVGTLVLWIFIARWPGIFYPVGFNIDEDQILAAARATALDPIFFRGAECGSSGPMNIYPLLWTLLFGQMPDLVTARWTGLGMLGLGLGILYFGARSVWQEGAVRMGLLFVGTFFGFTTFWDFVHFTSEHPSIFYMCVAGGIVLRFLGKPEIERVKGMLFAGGAGLFLGLIPWAKLQGAPWAVVMGVVLLVVLWKKGKASRCSWSWCATGGALLPTLVLLLLFWTGGVVDYFWKSYLWNALAYSGEGFSGWRRDHVLRALLFSPEPMRPWDFLIFGSSWLLLMAVTLVFLPRIIRRGYSPKEKTWLWVACGVYVGLALWTVLSPRRDYPHYLLFLPVPMAIWVMASLDLLMRVKFSRLFAVVCAGVLLLPMAGWRWSHPTNWSLAGRDWRAGSVDAVALAISSAAEGGNSRLTVWGYNPVYHTKTGFLPGTRLSTASSLFNANPLQNFFRETYVEDLQRQRPVVFVDAVAPGQFVMMTDREKHGHERIPEVAEFVAENYTLFAEVEGVRIYRANP